MDLQNAVIEYYLDELNKGTDPAAVVESAVKDPQLLLYSELMDHPNVQRVNSVWVERMRLVAYGTIQSIADPRPDWMTDQIFSKLQILSVLSFVGDNGWCGIQLDRLKEYVQCDSQLDLFKLLIDMNKRGILDVLIDERAGTMDVVNMHVFRDVDPKDIQPVIEKFETYIRHVKSVAKDGLSALSPDMQRLVEVMESPYREATMASPPMSVSPQIFKRGRNT